MSFRRGAGSIAQVRGMLTRSFVGGGARHYPMNQGFVSVFIDSTEIEVNGKCFEGAA